LYVTFAKQDSAKHDDVAGPGNGYVDIFDANGTLLKRLISGGTLNSPWGIALAPADFGDLSNTLLIGNFGDGLIHGYDPSNGTEVGVMSQPSGRSLVIPGLWSLTLAGGGDGSAANLLYFTAGIPGPGQVEDHGAFGQIRPAHPDDNSKGKGKGK
jgi:uncharacterized protein (TIGR03118 family)